MLRREHVVRVWRQLLVPAAPYVALLAVVVGLYGKSTGFQLLPTWDDDLYVINNPLIRGLSWESLTTLFSTTYFGHYAPLHLLSYALDFTLWGGVDAAGFHLTNVLLHGANACLVVAVVGAYTGKKSLAWWSALLFAVHPVNVENVAWVSERKTLLATLFFLVTLLCYRHFRESKRTRWLLAALLLFAMALLCKPIVVTLPLLLLCHEWFLRSKGERLWWPSIPFAILAAGHTAIALRAQIASGATGASFLSPDFLFGTAYPTILPAYFNYLRVLLWPVHLNAFYDVTMRHGFGQPVVLLSLLFWLAVFGVALRWGSGQVKFWLLWFPICLLPVSNLIPLPAFYADRYLYTPAIAFYVLAGMGASVALKRPRVAALWQAFERRCQSVLVLCTRGRATLHSAGLWMCTASILATFALLTSARLEVWRNELLLWQDTAAKSPRIYSARLNLGVAYQNSGQLDLAEREYRAAYAINPTREAQENLRMLELLRQLQGQSKSQVPR